MVIVETDYPSFNDYIATLSQPARKNWRECRKKNQDLRYEEVVFDYDKVKQFMEIWEQQLVRGLVIRWAFGPDHIRELDKMGQIKVFAAYNNVGTVAMHFIQKRKGYWETHPPMYDKERYSNRMLGKWMWFNLINWAIRNNQMPLNLGGGPDDWQEHLNNREKYPNPRYKFTFIPEAIKENPLSAKPYYIKEWTLHLRES
jgi:hypothetical protein